MTYSLTPGHLMLNRLFFVFFLVWTQSASAQQRAPGQAGSDPQSNTPSQEAAQQQKRRDALRAALRLQDGERTALVPRQRTARERAELREAVRLQREGAPP